MNGICALTGHRELPASFDKNALYDRLEELIGSGYDYFLCGMARGFDLLALECLLALRREFPVFIEACVPFPGQERGYGEGEKRRYREFLALCDKKTVLFDGYRDGCFLARDRYMIDRADAVLAYCTQTTGGTVYTVNYARRKGIPVIRV